MHWNSCKRRLAAWCIGAAGLATARGPALAQPCTRVSHTGISYAGQDLHGRNFSNQSLVGADFSNARLQGAVFTGANLSQADFTRAQIGLDAANRATAFDRANLTDACFAAATVGASGWQFANLACTVFDRTDLSQAVFGPAIRAADPRGPCRTSFAGATMNCEFIPQWKDLELAGANVKACYDRLAGVDFSGARMDRVDLSATVLDDTRWQGARLQGTLFIKAKLRRAVLSGADLRGAQLSQADATGAKLNNQVRLSGAALAGAVLVGADLTGAVMQAADGFQAANLSLAFMPDAVLTDGKLAGVNMSHVNFYGALAKADNANLQQLNFANANLGGLNLKEGLLRGVRMDGATLVNADLVGADLSPTPDAIASSLVQANLQGADLRSARLDGADLANAAVSLAEGVVLFKAPAGLAASLDRRELSAEVVEAFTSHGYHLVACEDPRVQAEVPGSRWQISLLAATGPAGARYARFFLVQRSAAIQVTGIPQSGPSRDLFTVDKGFAETLDKGLLASGLLAAFGARGYPLPPCANPEVSVRTAGSRWAIGETLTSLTSAGLGYTGFNLIVEAPAQIQAYGSEVTIIRPDEKGVLTLVPIPLQPTRLSPSAFDDTTTCPNQRTYGANRRSGVPWKEIVTAVSPPPPPGCIPSPTRFCPPS